MHEDLLCDELDTTRYYVREKAELCAVCFSGIVVVRVYSRPSPSDVTFVEQLAALYDDFSDTHQVIIAGNFNCHELKWLNSTHTDARGRALREFCEPCGLSQLVTEPTRGAAILALFVSPDQGRVEYNPPCGTLDHLTLIVTVSLLLELPSVPSDRLVFHWRRAPWSHICGAFRRVDWTLPTDVDSAASYLTNQILTITKRFVPHCKPQLVRPVPWWNGDCQWVGLQNCLLGDVETLGDTSFFCRSARRTYHSAFQCYQQCIRKTLFTRGSRSRVWWHLTRDIAGFSTHRQRVVPPLMI